MSPPRRRTIGSSSALMWVLLCRSAEAAPGQARHRGDRNQRARQAGRRYLRVRTAAISGPRGGRGEARQGAFGAPHQAAAPSRRRRQPRRAAARQAGAQRLGTGFNSAPSARAPDAERIRCTSFAKETIQAFVLETKYYTAERFYLVRVPGLQDRAAADARGAAGAAVLQSKDVLIGESRRAPGLHPRPPPR